LTGSKEQIGAMMTLLTALYVEAKMKGSAMIFVAFSMASHQLEAHQAHRWARTHESLCA
jgi:hypothetical protein